MTTTRRTSRLAAAFPLVLAAGLLAACGQATTESTTLTPPAPEAPATTTAQTPVAKTAPAQGTPVANVPGDGETVEVWSVSSKGAG